MITQVFPDEFHLNSLDQLLSAIARLNPHVNIKAIVIGLMDRLSTYAAQEAESESSEDRLQTEKDATIRLMDKLRVSGETEKPEVKADGVDGKQTNGEHINGDKSEDSTLVGEDGQPSKVAEPSVQPTENESPSGKHRGIPENVKLYEIFYDQVINLVNAQRLHIQDTIALLVSLSNLAL